VEGSIEDSMLALKERKAALAKAVLSGGTTTSLQFAIEDAEELLSAWPAVDDWPALGAATRPP